MNHSNQDIGINFSLVLIDNSKNIPVNNVLPCSVLVNNIELGGIFITCSSRDMKYFNITPLSLPEPFLKFRMLDIDKELFVIEIWLIFENDSEKILKMHLNPNDSNVKKLLRFVVETGVISFHFYNKSTQLLLAGITVLDNEQIEWFDRNYKLSTNMTSDQIEYAMLSEHLAKDISKIDRFYTYFAHHNADYFIQDGKKQVMLGNISELN